MIPLELLINLMKLMRTQTPPYFRIVLLVNLHARLNLIVMIIFKCIQTSFILIKQDLRLLMIVSLRVIVL